MQITGGAAPAQYSFGNTGRNVLFGPGTNNLDFDLHRDFPIPWESEYAWSFPARWFNMKDDKVVLIGDEFWEKVGGKGAYRSFITAINEIGPAYKERIYREFLGIEPPGDVTEGAL